MMLRQALKWAWPERGHGGLSPAAIGVIAPPNPGATTIVWRQRALLASFRQHIARWRARNWRRVVLAWFVLSLAIMAIASEPKTDFPKVQARSVPAVRMVLRVAGVLTVAGVPVLLIALP